MSLSPFLILPFCGIAAALCVVFFYVFCVL